MAQKSDKKCQVFSPDLAQGLVKILAKCLVKIWVKFWVKILVKQDNKSNSIYCNSKGARASRARPFLVSVPGVVSVVLFDQNLDPKLDPNLHQTLGQNIDQTLGQNW